MQAIASNLHTDPQRLAHQRCPVCGSAVYPPTYFCIRCERDGL